MKRLSIRGKLQDEFRAEFRKQFEVLEELELTATSHAELETIWEQMDALRKQQEECLDFYTEEEMRVRA